MSDFESGFNAGMFVCGVLVAAVMFLVRGLPNRADEYQRDESLHTQACLARWRRAHTPSDTVRVLLETDCQPPKPEGSPE